MTDQVAEHRVPALADTNLARQLQRAFGWSSRDAVGRGFARANLPSEGFAEWLFSTDRLFELITSRDLVPPQLRFVKNGAPIDADHFIATPAARAPRPDPTKISRLLQDGATLILNFADEVDARLALACRSLQWWLGEVVKVNVYLTTGPTRGFNIHWDAEDVVIVQIDGTKEWDVRGTYPMPGDGAHQADPPPDSVWQGELKRGAAIYLPRGQWHAAGRNDDGFSLHLTFSLAESTGVDWLVWAADRAREVELFRRRLPDDVERANDHARLLKEAVSEFLDNHGPSMYRQKRPIPSNRRGHIFVPNVGRSFTHVLCVTDFPPLIVHGEKAGTVEVRAADTVIKMSAKAEPVLRKFLSGSPIDLGLISETVSFDVGPIVEVLLSHGICARVSDEFAAAPPN